MKIKNMARRIRSIFSSPPEPKETAPEERRTGCLLASLAVTFRCMCKCAHCGSSTLFRAGEEEMSTEELKDIIRQLRETGTNSVNFFGGEPLIRKDLLELVRCVKSLGMGAAIDTNGFLLDRETAFALAEAGMDMVHVSIDSADPETHDKMRGVRGVFDKAVDAIKYSKEAGMTVRIGAYVDRKRLNNGEFQKLIDLGVKLGAPLRTLTPVFTGRWREAEEERLTPGEILKFKSMLAPDVAYWEQETCNSRDAGFICACAVKDYIYITAYGDVTPCVYVPLSFGNVRAEPLKKILDRMWSHEMFSSISCDTCITNIKGFREKYFKHREKPGTYPIWIE